MANAPRKHPAKASPARPRAILVLQGANLSLPGTREPYGHETLEHALATNGGK